MNNREVIQAWVRGKRGRSSNGNLSTDGKILYSYKLMIGTTEHYYFTTHSRDYKIVIDYTGEHSYSQTTSCHVGLAKQHCTVWKNP